MARPRKEETYEKRNRITVRMTDLELEEIRRMAKRQEKSVSEYVRDQAVTVKEKHAGASAPSIDDVKPLTEEFHKIGANLNQIAHHLNGGGTATDGLEKEIKQHMDELRILREKVIKITGE